MCKSVYYFPFLLLLPRFGQISETEIEKIEIEKVVTFIELHIASILRVFKN